MTRRSLEMPKKHSKPIVRKAKRPVERSRELEWLNEHRDQYLGKWVVVEGDRLIAACDTAREAFDQAKRHGLTCPFLTHVFKSVVYFGPGCPF